MINVGTYIALGAVSGTTIAFQIVLIQIFSFTQWYHFAFMVISTALLGGGVAGIILTLGRMWFLKRFELIYFPSIALAGLSMLGSVYLSQLECFRFDSFLLFTNVGELLKLPLNYLIFLTPFFFSSLAVGLFISVKHGEIGRVYFWSLSGAALGALTGWALLWYLSPEATLTVLAGLNLIAVVIAGGIRTWFLGRVAVAAGLVGLFLASVYPPPTVLSEYKDLRRILNLPHTRWKDSLCSPYGRIDIVESPLVRYAPAISLAFEGQPPTPPLVFMNGDLVGPLFTLDYINQVAILNYTLGALPWAIETRKEVLILSAGSGERAAYALYRGAEKVTAVESNPLLANLIRQNLAVKVLSMEPRSYLEVEHQNYDLISFPTLGNFGGNGGINAIKESYIYTVEGIRAAWGRLSGKGLLMILTWEDYPLRYSLRVAATIKEALEREIKERLLDHISVVRGLNQMAFLVKKTPFSAEEKEKIVNFCKELGFSILPCFPGEAKGYLFKISPARDSRPYPHQFIKLSSLSAIEQRYGWTRVPYFEVGYVLIWLTLLEIIVLSSLLIFLPLKLKRSLMPGPDKMPVFLYFSGIGMGYMCVEIAFIEKYVLLFGSVPSSFMVVVSLMLFFSALGSWAVSSVTPERNKLLILVGIISLGIFILGFTLTSVLLKSAGNTLLISVLLALLTIGPVSFFMGMPFPLGIKILGQVGEEVIPWAWGVNGFFSVVGACLATVLAVEVGFVLLMIFASLCYSKTVLLITRL